MLHSLHHIAIICSDYQLSKKFYTEVLGFQIMAENYRAERNSWKLDLALNGEYAVELFSFPNPPPRPSQPESCGLRHLAFGVRKLEETIAILQSRNIISEPLRTDIYTGKKFTFIADPDLLPIELYEI